MIPTYLADFAAGAAFGFMAGVIVTLIAIALILPDAPPKGPDDS